MLFAMSSTADRSRTVVIGVPVYGRLELVRTCLAAIDRHTPIDVGMLIVDDCGPERLTEDLVAGALCSGRPWTLIAHSANRGFVHTANEIFELTEPHDTLLVNSDVEVLPGWFEGLVEASADERTASASSLADRGGILSVPNLSRGASQDDLARVRSTVGSTAQIPVAVAHCTLFGRKALAAVGGFDVRFSPGYGEEVDWSLRAARAGLGHVAALGSFVLHAESASFGRATGFMNLQRRHELRLLARYPVSWIRIRRFARNPNTDLAIALRRIRHGFGEG